MHNGFQFITMNDTDFFVFSYSDRNYARPFIEKAVRLKILVSASLEELKCFEQGHLTDASEVYRFDTIAALKVPWIFNFMKSLKQSNLRWQKPEDPPTLN